MLKVIITGGAGFIGSQLAIELIRQFKNIELIIIDNLHSGTIKNLDSVKTEITLTNLDIINYHDILSLMKNTDWVFHLAALTSITESVNNPLISHEINSTGTLNVLWAALQAKVSRVVIASSCSVYGDIHQPPLQETYLPNPKSPYAASKLTAESLAESFYYSYGLETVCLRYFNVYGLRQRADSDYAAVIPRFIECYQQKKPPQIYGNGQQCRDFIHVSDVARANILAAKLPSDILKKYRVFNIGTGKSTSLLQLLDTISQTTGFLLEPHFHESRQGDIKNSCADISLAQKYLNFSPLINLEEGIKSLL